MRRLLTTLIFLILLALASLWVWVKWVYLPGPGKVYLSNRLSELAGVAIEIQGLSFDPSGTLTLKGVTAKTHVDAPPVVTAEKLTLGFKLESLIIHRELTISSFRIRNAMFRKDSNGIRFNLTTQGALSIPLNKKRELETTGIMLVTSGSIEGIPALGALDQLKGTLFTDREVISFHEFSARILGLECKLEGKLTLAENPTLSIQLKTQGPLQESLKWLSDPVPPEIEKLNLTGQFDLDIGISLPLHQAQAYDLKGDLVLENVEASYPTFSVPIKTLQGKIHFTKETATVDSMTFELGGIPHKLSSHIAMADTPMITLNLESPDMTIQTQFALWTHSIHIVRAQGVYREVGFDVSGTIPSFQGPAYELKGVLKANLEDLMQWTREPNQNLPPTFQGPLTANGSLTGQGWSPEKMKGRFEVTSPEIAFFERFHMQDLQAMISLEEGQAVLEGLRAYLYGGLVRALGEISLIDPKRSYRLRTNVTHADLRELVPHKTAVQKQITGYLSGEAVLHGKQTDLNTMEGRGRILLSEGQIWKIPLFRGLSGLLQISGLEGIPIYGGRGSFKIKKKQISTENLVLDASHYQLLTKGSLGFDSKLNLNVTTRVSQESPGATGIIPQELLKYAEVDITGTLQDPKYHVKNIRPDELIWDTLKEKLLSTLLDKI
jgi:hypothetical protein